MNSATQTTVCTVAHTILAQLGGNRFLVMTGSKAMSGTDSLHITLSRAAKDGIKKVRIVLDASDTYTVSFFKTNKRTFETTTISETSFVFADQLQAVFTAATGRYTRL